MIPKHQVYHCKKCKAFVLEKEIKCHKCGNLLINDGAVKSKTTTYKEFIRLYEKERPPFELDRWYHILFYALGWLNVGNLIFWISAWLVYGNSVYEERFIYNPDIKRLFFNWGIILVSVLVFLSVIFLIPNFTY